MSVESGDKPFWAKCKKCAHCFIVAYTPMELRAFAKCCAKAICPKCGADSPWVAKQNDGELLEDV